MPLVEKEPVVGGQLVDPDQYTVVDRTEAREGLTDLRKDAEALPIPGARREGVSLEIPGQPDARGDDDVGVLARGVEPASAAVGKEREIQHYSIPRSLSRMSAASSNCSASTARLRRSRSSVALETCGSADGRGAT